MPALTAIVVSEHGMHRTGVVPHQHVVVLSTMPIYQTRLCSMANRKIDQWPVLVGIMLSNERSVANNG